MTVPKCIIGHDGNKNNLRTIEAPIVQRLDPIRSGLFLGAWARGGGEPAAHNSKTIHGIEMNFGRVVENNKLINLA